MLKVAAESLGMDSRMGSSGSVRLPPKRRNDVFHLKDIESAQTLLIEVIGVDQTGSHCNLNERT